MQYLGGKQKQAKDIARTILEDTDYRGSYIEPFVGMGSVLRIIGPHFSELMAGDLSEDLILMYQALQRGWRPPRVLPQDVYDSLKLDNPSAVRAFAGFGVSFRAKWFGGYAGVNNKFRTAEDFSRAASNSLDKISEWLSTHPVEFMHRSFTEWEIYEGDVVYADPPYANTTGYATGKFDHDLFWRTMKEWTDLGAEVYVSEFEAPSGWNIIWEKSRKVTLSNTSSVCTHIDRLYKLA